MERSKFYEVLETTSENADGDKWSASLVGTQNQPTVDVLFFDEEITRSFGSFDVCLLMNILHHISPANLISTAYQMLSPGGRIGICHWRDDIDTPRGPPQDMRIGLSKAKELVEF